MKQIERQDIKTMSDKLTSISYRIEYEEHEIVESAISMLEDLGNMVHNLQQENAKLKQGVLQLEAMIED